MKGVNKIQSNLSGRALAFRGRERREPQLLRILLHSGFGAKCGAPHFAPLLPNTQSLDADLTEGLRSWSSIAGDRFSGIGRKIRRET